MLQSISCGKGRELPLARGVSKGPQRQTRPSQARRAILSRIAVLRVPLAAVLLAWALAPLPPHAAAEDPPQLNEPPEGFVALFNGKNLDGWIGRGHFDPRRLATMSPEERADFDKDNAASLAAHWRVEDGEIVNDGQGVYLTTGREYGDFELLVDWKMVSPNTDSGIYLRGCPQVQIWDPDNPREVKNGAPRGSGALWNNNADAPGRFPTVKADRPVGEWNTFRIRMVGDRVTVHFNGQLVVDDAVMNNFWDRESPMFARGVIQLQTHGGEMRFRNVFLRELGDESE